MAKNYSALYLGLDQALKAGRVAEVREALEDLNTSALPGNLRLKFANLCRRVNLPSKGLRILDWHNASPEELAEYAVLLQRSGATREALRILGRLNSSSRPEVLLYQAFCHFNLWQYEPAIPLLEKYLTFPLDEYARAVGKINLAAALSGVQRLNDEHIAALLTEFRAKNYTRLLANALELGAQNHLFSGNLAKAKENIHEAEEILKASASLDGIFVRKWRAAIECVEKSDPAPLKAFRAEAEKLGDWESVRDADLLSLRVKFEWDLFDRVYFGSPFSGYRERVKLMLGKGPRSSQFVLGPQNAPAFDIKSGTFAGQVAIKPGSQTHKLIDVLFRDFYKPFNVGGLFSELFNGEHFDIESSPARVHQAVKQARKTLKNSDIDLEIVSENNLFSIKIAGHLQVIIPLEREERSPNQILLELLRASGKQEFSAADARELLGISAGQFKTFAAWAIEDEKLEKFGAGSATRYLICRVDKVA